MSERNTIVLFSLILTYTFSKLNSIPTFSIPTYGNNIQFQNIKTPIRIKRMIPH